MLHYLLQDLDLRLDTTIVYGTCFSESSALEKYLDSFPHASPTAFQTSIHPGGIEQALILDNREVGAFMPMAGSRTLFLQMLKVALAAASEEVVICGGEEKGGWLRDFNLAYTSSFSFAMRLGGDSSTAIGELVWMDGDEPATEQIPELEQAVRDLKDVRELEMGGPGLGRLKISLK